MFGRAAARWGLVLILVAGLAGGCNDREGTADRGAGGGGDLEAFDVVARFTGLTSSVAPLSFTLVLDRASGRVIVGGNGRAAVGDVTDAKGSFHAQGSMDVAAPGDCLSFADFELAALDFSIAGGVLTGTASGHMTLLAAALHGEPFTATLEGKPDATPPQLTVFGLLPRGPFDGLTLVASEPLPAGVTARLVSSHAATVELVPIRVGRDVPLTVGFRKPDVVLAPGTGYSIQLSGLVDFAGLSVPAGPPLRLFSLPAVAPAAEDGFESVTGVELGGGTVVSPDGFLPPIAGAKSLYVAPQGAPFLSGLSGQQLTIRLPRHAGDTKVVFSYRLVADWQESAMGAFAGTVWLGTEGASAGLTVSPAAVPGPTEILSLVTGPSLFSQVGTMEIALPEAGKDEVLFGIIPTDFGCRPPAGLAGMLVDDLRLE